MHRLMGDLEVVMLRRRRIVEPPQKVGDEV